MNFRRFALLTLVLLTACSPSIITPQSPEVQPFVPTQDRPAPTFTPVSTLTVAPLISSPSARVTATPFSLPTGYVISDPIIGIDFTAELCNARWMNNGKNLPCPGRDPRNSPDGYVGFYDAALLNVKENNPAILTYPAQNTFEGIFGRYPAYEVRSGDQFYTYVTCLPDAPCDVQFALDYYDGNGGYHNNFVGWHYRSGEPMKEVIIELSPLAGQSLEFVLGLRPTSNRESAYALWIGPRIIITAPPQ